MAVEHLGEIDAATPRFVQQQLNTLLQVLRAVVELRLDVFANRGTQEAQEQVDENQPERDFENR